MLFIMLIENRKSGFPF